MTLLGAVAAVLAIAAGATLVARRDTWARDLYQLPNNRLGRGVVASLGLLLIAAAMTAVVEALS